jgi:hypothetical protein
MSNIIHAAMTFALLPHGRMAHIDDVANGGRCGCVCPQCKQALIAKNGGQERSHHFAHEGGAECDGGTETSLHLAAKQIVADQKRLVLPFALGEIGSEETKFVELDNVQLEYALRHPSTQQRIIADCYGENASGPIIIEIAVHHRVESEKAAMINSLLLAAIEIDLSDLLREMIGWEELQNAVLFDAFRRRWICTPPSLEAVEPEATVVCPVPKPSLKEWCFAIGQTWIWVKEFQSGDVRVFHRYDQRVREIVEPMCRRRGYWNAQYKNWIVFMQFKEELLELLGRQGRVVHAPSR